MVTKSVHRSRVQWNGGGPGDIRAQTIELAEQTLAASSAPDSGGDSKRADPEELFVASPSSCHMLWFLALARTEKIRVAIYEDEAEGTLDGTRFEGDVFGAGPGALHTLPGRLCLPGELSSAAGRKRAAIARNRRQSAGIGAFSGTSARNGGDMRGGSS